MDAGCSADRMAREIVEARHSTGWQLPTGDIAEREPINSGDRGERQVGLGSHTDALAVDRTAERGEPLLPVPAAGQVIP